jgi:hypothetical protein
MPSARSAEDRVAPRFIQFAEKRGAEMNIALLIGRIVLGGYWLMASSQEIAMFSPSSGQSLIVDGIPYHERSSFSLHL